MHIFLLSLLTLIGVVMALVTHHTQNPLVAILTAAIAAIIGIGWAALLWRG